MSRDCEGPNGNEDNLFVLKMDTPTVLLKDVA